MKIEHVYPSCTFQEFMESNDLTLRITQPLTPGGRYKATIKGMAGGYARFCPDSFCYACEKSGSSIAEAVQNFVFLLRDYKEILVSDPTAWVAGSTKYIKIPQKLRVPPNSQIVAWAKSSEREQEARAEELKKEANK